LYVNRLPVEPVAPVEIGKMSDFFTGKQANGLNPYRVSILNRFDESLNIHKNKCEIPPILAEQCRHGH